MAKKTRADVQPEILLPDLQDLERSVRDHIGPKHGVKIWRRDTNDRTVRYTYVFDATRQRLAELRRNNVRLDEGLVHFMMRSCSLAAHVFIERSDQHPIVPEGTCVARLVRVGCRVYLQQDAIAAGYGCSRGHVNEQIALMRKHGLVVNQGHGWYEFDASLCWRGSIDLMKAYRQQQIVRDGIEIRQGSRIIQLTEDMETEPA